MKYIEYSEDELSVLRKASLTITEKDTTGVIFGFAHLNAGPKKFGTYGGFSFLLYESGLVKVQEYLFSDILAEERRYAVPRSCVNIIKCYYSKNQAPLSALYAPHNDSCDGSFSKFFFGNEWISSLNIEYHDENEYERVRELHPEDFYSWVKVFQSENDIMNAFFDVCSILKDYDVILEQFRVTAKGVSTTSNAEFMECN